MKIGNEYFPPIFFSSLRYFLGSLILLAIVFYNRRPFPRLQDLKWYALCGLLQTTLLFAVAQLVINHVDIGVTATLSFSMPFWLAIMAHFLIKGDQITPAKLTGLIIGIIGVFLVMDVNVIQMKWDSVTLFYQSLVLLGAIGWAVSNVIVKKQLQNHDMLQFTGYQMFIGACGLLIASLIFDPNQSVIWSWRGASSLLFAGVVASAFAFVLWFHILSAGQASKAAVSLLLVPVFGVLFGWLLLGETLGSKALIGILFVLIGLGIVNIKKKQQAEPVYSEVSGNR
jgi:O-acetylserine/cysteine efflux transporter